MKKILFASLFKTIIVTLLFAIVYKFYYLELIRGNIEDIAYDTIDKFIIAKKEQNTSSPKVMLFTIDNTYLKVNKLIDDDNETTYGYFLPNDQIVKFLNSLDEYLEDIEPKNMPKILFIDFDFSFTTAEYGKKLNPGDKELLKSLAKDRNYTILLPKTSKYNFIENSNNTKIQELIKNRKIIFVSVGLQKSADNTIRRYSSYLTFKDKNSTKDYVNVAIAVKQIIENSEINTTFTKNLGYKQKDIIANRIILKNYKNSITENNCTSMQSYWKNYIKYSASCNLYDLDENDFAKSIILFGATNSNRDAFNTLNIFGTQNFYGVEIHANAIETLFFYNGQLKQLEFKRSVALIFIIFFIISFTIAYIFKLLKIGNSEVAFLVTLAVVISVLMLVSIYLLNEYKVWFNWLVPLILYEIIELLEYLQNLLINKTLKGGVK